MTDDVKQAIADLLRTIVRNEEATAIALEGVARLIESKEELPEPSRSSHYS